MRRRRARLPLADARRELAEIRARLVGLLQDTVGPALTAEGGQEILERAKAWSPPMARELHAHIAQFPDALTAPSPHCPASLPRLLQALEAAGHGDAVTQLACVICGRAGRKIPRLTPQGRACDWCVSRTELHPCSCCGKDGHIVTRTEEEGAVCRSCYESRHRFTGPCADCGRPGTYRMRHRDGARVALCRPCAGFTDQECVRCKTVGPVQSNSAEGPVCRRCYVAPAKLCGKCGQLRRLAKRGKDGEPGVCDNCYRFEGMCAACGRFRDGARSSRAGGDFLCDPCRPRPTHRCVDCGRNKKATVTTWPVGPLCSPCYNRRRRNPEPCALCGVTRVLVGHSDEGLGTCGPCCGTDIDFTCRRCGSSADISTDGCCTRCVADDRVHELLADENGQIATVLAPLAQALSSAPRPRSVLAWLRRSPSARLLATLAASQAEITHELLDDLPQEPATHYVRELLVHAGILPSRQENLVQLELWFRAAAQHLPAAHSEIIRPFAEWFIIRDARRRATRRRYTDKAAHSDRSEIRAAIEFMQWLDDRHLDLRALTQTDLEVWLAQAKPSRPRLTAAFIKWTNKRGLTRNLEYPGYQRPAPATFLDDDDQADQLRRCLTDTTLPLDIRIAGALIRLYGLPITRIVNLTADQFHEDDIGAYFTFDKNPVLLPPTLARLIERQIAEGRRHSAVGALPDSEHQALLLPGRLAGRPRSPGGLAAQLAKHGLPTLAARNTALFGMAGELPPIIMCDLFGIHRNTATQWAALAQDSWAGYLAALRNDSDG